MTLKNYFTQKKAIISIEEVPNVQKSEPTGGYFGGGTWLKMAFSTPNFLKKGVKNR